MSSILIDLWTDRASRSQLFIARHNSSSGLDLKGAPVHLSERGEQVRFVLKVTTASFPRMAETWAHDTDGFITEHQAFRKHQSALVTLADQLSFQPETPLDDP